jgi:sporulation protein YlmC with PRC-barrel domain
MTGTMTGTDTMTDTKVMTGTNSTDVTPEATAEATATPSEEGAIDVQIPMAVRLSELLDFGVRNPDGEDLGSLEDIVIDWQHSRLAYPIISFGGFLGMGDKWFVIPFDAVTLNLLDRNFVFDVTAATLESAPGFDPDQLPDTTDPNWDLDIRDFWGM